jgi:hypothetical protein
MISAIYWHLKSDILDQGPRPCNMLAQLHPMVREYTNFGQYITAFEIIDIR